MLCTGGLHAPDADRQAALVRICNQHVQCTSQMVFGCLNDHGMPSNVKAAPAMKLDIAKNTSSAYLVKHVEYNKMPARVLVALANRMHLDDVWQFSSLVPQTLDGSCRLGHVPCAVTCFWCCQAASVAADFAESIAAPALEAVSPGLKNQVFPLVDEAASGNLKTPVELQSLAPALNKTTIEYVAAGHSNECECLKDKFGNQHMLA